MLSLLLTLPLSAAALGPAGEPRVLAQALASARAGDFTRAFELWAPLAEAGSAEAQYNLALLFERGQGVAPDPAQAMWWYLKAANQSHAYAMYNLAAMFRDGRGAPRDPAEAARRYRQAAELGVPGAAWWLSRQLNREGQWPEAYYWAYRAAVAGDAVAQAEVARCLADGVGVTPDRVAAAAWAVKAAERRQPRGLLMRARALAEAWDGRAADPVGAINLLRAAAEQGEAEAERRLGLAYARGDGTTQDFGQAVFWFTRAARQGDPEAQYLLALAFRLGRGLPVSLPTAWAWCSLASQAGHPEAGELLGLLEQDLASSPEERQGAVAVLAELRRGLVQASPGAP